MYIVIRSVFKIRGDAYYSCEITDKIPVEVAIHAIHQNTGLGLIYATNEDILRQYIDALENTDEIVSVDITFKSPTTYWTKVEQVKSDYGIHARILASGSMNSFPIIIKDGWQYHRILSPNGDKFRKLYRHLEEEFTVKLLQSSTIQTGHKKLLTSKQHTAQQEGYTLGYYELPRRVTLGQIADAVQISRSALQERIHRAEASLVDYYFKSGNFFLE